MRGSPKFPDCVNEFQKLTEFNEARLKSDLLRITISGLYWQSLPWYEKLWIRIKGTT